MKLERQTLVNWGNTQSLISMRNEPSGNKPNLFSHHLLLYLPPSLLEKKKDSVFSVRIFIFSPNKLKNAAEVLQHNFDNTSQTFVRVRTAHLDIIKVSFIHQLMHQ